MSKDTLYCSFCGKSQHQVRKLFVGLTGSVCDKCVELFTEVLRSPFAFGVRDEQLIAASRSRVEDLRDRGRKLTGRWLFMQLGISSDVIPRNLARQGLSDLLGDIAKTVTEFAHQQAVHNQRKRLKVLESEITAKQSKLQKLRGEHMKTVGVMRSNEHMHNNVILKKLKKEKEDLQSDIQVLERTYKLTRAKAVRKRWFDSQNELENLNDRITLLGESVSSVVEAYEREGMEIEKLNKELPVLRAERDELRKVLPSEEEEKNK